MATKRFAPKLKIKTGDKVMVIAGNDRGKTGDVLQVFPQENRAIVSGIRLVIKHRKPNAQTGTPGDRVEMEAPIHLSNLMLVDAKGQTTRVGRRVEGGKLVRYSKKTGQTIQ
jgi:large subunit ribosomal protein L24